MPTVEVIYLIAAVLWIGVVLGALAVGIYVACRLRARRRRLTRILDVVRSPAREARALTVSLADWSGTGPRPPVRRRRRRGGASRPHRSHAKR